MRLNSVNLLAYGHLKDTPLDFSDQAAGVHVIYGPNEAGKTTIKSAIEELLFGFHARTPYEFEHGYTALRLSGAVENAAGELLEFTRVKKNKNDLLSASGGPLPDDALAPYLRGVTRDAFCMQFSLSRANMIAGSKDIEDGRGEIGESLYNAALGNASLSQLIKRLDDRIGQLFTAKSKTQRLNTALKAFDVAKTALNQALVRPQAWVERVRERDTVDEQFADVDARLASLARTAGLCTRLLGQAQAYERLVILRKDLVTREGDNTLTEKAVARAEALLESLHQAHAAVDTANEQIAELLEGHSSEEDSPLLVQATAIRALVERVDGYRTKRDDLQRLDLRLNAMRNAEAANRSLKRVWPNVDLETARDRNIPQTTIASGSALVLEHTRLSTATSAAKAAVDELAEDMESITEELSQLASAKELTALRAAIASGSAEGRLDQQITSAETKVLEQVREADIALRALGMFTGDLAALASAALPLRETMETAKSGFERVDREKALLDQRQTGAQGDRDNARQQLERVAREGAVRTIHDLEAARQIRDGVFEELAQGWRKKASSDELDAVGDLYRPTVSNADGVADELRRNADRVASVIQLRGAEESAERELATIEQLQSQNIDQRDALATDWSATWASLDIVPLTPAQMVAWLEKAVMLRKNREEIDQNRANLSEKLATRADLVAVLTESIRAIGRELPPSQRLEPLLAGARDIVAEIEQIEAKRTKLHAGLARDQRQIKQKRKAEADGMAALEKLEQAWQAILDATWLPRELRPETFSEMLALLEQFRTADTKARSDQERADGIERDTAAFRADVVAVAVEHAPDLEALADKAPDSVVTTLADRLAQAQTAHDRRADREEVLERARLSRDATQVRLQGITDQLSSLAITVGVERDAFEQVVARSKETLKIRRDIDSLREDVETGTGLSLETCDVEFAGRTRADLDGDLVVARENERSLVGERDDVFAKKREIEAELSAMENSELAANAEAEIIAIGAQIDQDARHWAELTLARFVLDEQIREYADKNQGALIARSGHFFRRLTAGAYQKLRAVSEDNKNYLEAVDQKDRSTRVDGLSEGTRDQLYFALRLAALEHHFKDNEAQPVILDDAFVAFDDQRSKLAFEVMAEFAKTTQVIYFTHHYACVESAIAAVPSGMLNVHKLPSRWESEIPANSAVLAGTPALRRVGPLALTIAAFEV